MPIFHHAPCSLIGLVFFIVGSGGCQSTDAAAQTDRGVADAQPVDSDATANVALTDGAGLPDAQIGKKGDHLAEVPPPQLPPAPWQLCTKEQPPPSATVITAFDQADQYFNPQDKRKIDATVDFPTNGEWARIDMRLELSCPADGDCDNWDRFANVMLVENPGTTQEQIVELERYITPYNVGLCFTTDVSRFGPKLQGKQTIRSFIDTWVGPNEPAHGHGWRVTVTFIFHPGKNTNLIADQMIQLWSYAEVEVGNPDNPLAQQLIEKQITIPTDTKRAELRTLVTGHGQGNAINCAEFCHLTHKLMVNQTANEHDPWRGDCDQNPIGKFQAGTWTHERAGWCPGAYVLPKVFDVTAQIQPGKSNSFGYQIVGANQLPFTNTCRPGAGTVNNTCVGCVFTNQPGNCDYNGGYHTPPVIRVAVQLLLYR